VEEVTVDIRVEGGEEVAVRVLSAASSAGGVLRWLSGGGREAVSAAPRQSS
jgi:hypothetical protein